MALTFIGLPFVVRTLQPALEDMDMEIEEAAASLGATRRQTFVRVILPTILPALLTGFALAFARALGEYGSVVFISSKLEKVIPMLIYTKLEQYHYRRGGGHRRGHAGGVVRRAVVHQFDRNGGAGGTRVKPTLTDAGNIGRENH